MIHREDEDAVRAVECFTRRGIPRVKAEGFDYTAPAPPRDKGGDRRPPRRPGEVRAPRPVSRRDFSQERSSEGSRSQGVQKIQGGGGAVGAKGDGEQRPRSRGRSDGKPRTVSMSGEAGKSAGGPAKKGGIGRFLGFGRR